MTRNIYMIDGVPVPKKVYRRRKKYGEHAEAKFSVVVKK
jgi:hypothetical protein